MSSLAPLWSGPLSNVVAGQPLFDASGWLLAPGGPVTAEPIFVALLAVGFVGMSIKSVFDSILSDEETEETSDDGGDDGLMPEEGGDDFGGLGGLDDGGDDFGEFEDDEFGDMDTGADTDELEHRLDELETEVGSLSSTVNTVRNENEQISETVDDVEENVRKLLDIYEMVTRGVNPFADDIDAGGLGGAGDNSFGLFDDDGGDEEDELEEGIANADAEGFFDEDLVEEDEGELEADADVNDVLGTEEADGSEDGSFEDEFDDDFADEDFDMDDDFDDESVDDSGDSEGGKSFAELKDEYESGDADWAEGEEDPALDDAVGDDREEDQRDDSERVSDTDEPASSEDGFADDDLFDTVIDEEEDDPAVIEQSDVSTVDDVQPDEEDTIEEMTEDVEDTTQDIEDTETPLQQAPSDQSTAVESDESTPSTTDDTSTTGSADEASDAQRASDEGKPYLTELPDGFVADLIIVEWLEFLVDDVGVRETSEAIHYYERIDWIDEAVADQLQAYLKGFDADGGRATLTIDHHTRSLRYVSQLNGGGAASVALEQMPAMAGGGSDGIQR